MKCMAVMNGLVFLKVVAYAAPNGKEFSQQPFRSVGVIDLLETTYLNPGIVSAESILCDTIHILCDTIH